MVVGCEVCMLWGAWTLSRRLRGRGGMADMMLYGTVDLWDTKGMLLSTRS